MALSHLSSLHEPFALHMRSMQASSQHGIYETIHKLFKAKLFLSLEIIYKCFKFESGTTKCLLSVSWMYTAKWPFSTLVAFWVICSLENLISLNILGQSTLMNVGTLDRHVPPYLFCQKETCRWIQHSVYADSSTYHVLWIMIHLNETWDQWRHLLCKELWGHPLDDWTQILPQPYSAILEMKAHSGMI